MSDPTSLNCPACGAVLDSNSSRCRECGYDANQTHINGKELEFSIQDTNPYSPPRLLDAETARPTVFDLTEEGARSARKLVATADYFVPLIVVCWCCLPVGIVVLPWYVLCLVRWHQLNRTYSELRIPDRLSPHATLAVDFQNARRVFWNGLGIVSLIWLAIIIGVALL